MTRQLHPAGTFGVRGNREVVRFDGERWQPVCIWAAIAKAWEWTRDSEWVRDHCAVSVGHVGRRSA